MKKRHLKRNSLGILSIVVISLLLFFSSGPLAHADLPEPKYLIGYFDVTTRTFAGGAPQLIFWFTLHDANYWFARHMESVVDSVTITYPDLTQHTFIPDLNAWCFTDRQSIDWNPQDGTIDPSAGEYEVNANCGTEYEVIIPEAAHVVGTYSLEVECNNDQDLFASYHPDEAGMTAAELPPVTNVTAGFNPDGLFQVSWVLPEGGYEDGANIHVFIGRYDKKGGRMYDRFRVRNLPKDWTSHTFFKWESDILRLFTGYIDVKVSIYKGWLNVANSEVMEYKIKKLLK